MLSDTPRQKLAAMIALDGIKVASDAKLCEALLRDYCGEYRIEIAALTAAVRWGIPKSLNESGLVPQSTLRAMLARRLQENHGLAEESAYWAVDAWASVLANQANFSPTLDESKRDPDADPGDTRSMPAGPVSPQPQWQSPQPRSPYQPPSPPIQPLPKPPSEPHAPPPPRPYQPQSPPLPPAPPPLSQPAPPRPPYQPQSPALPPLPRSPSEPLQQPPPRPASPYQAQSPPLPPLPKPPSQAPPPPAPPYQPPPPPVSKPPYQPPPPPASPYQPPAPKPPSQPSPPPAPPYQPASPPQPAPPYQPQSPALPLPFAAAGRAFESRQTTSELQQVQTYLKTELKKRKAAALQEELRLAGVQSLSARRMVGQAQRAEALQHVGIALVVFMASGIMAALSTSLHLGMDEASYLVCGSAFVYLMYRGVRVIATF